VNQLAAAPSGSGPGVFGAVADVYGEVRPGYPAALGGRRLECHGGAPTEIVEPGRALDALGPSVMLDLRTTLVLAKA